MRKIAITGASGMLGEAVTKHLSGLYTIFATSRSKGVEGKNIEWECFDLTDHPLLMDWLERKKPDVIIHCAAIVNVDFCEVNIEPTTELHVESTRTIANYADKSECKLIYISTDSVFDGKKPYPNLYNESDLVTPLNVYAKTKLAGEEVVQTVCNSLILRVNIIGWTQNHTSFFEWLLEGIVNKEPLNLFYDVYFSPLSVYHVSHIIERAIQLSLSGLYHCTSADSISKYDFGKLVCDTFQLSNSNIRKASVDSMEFAAERPKNMALDSKKLSEDANIRMPTVLESVVTLKANQQRSLYD